VWTWFVVHLQLIYYLLGATLILLTTLGYFLAFMVILCIKTNLCFGTLLDVGKDYYGPWLCIDDFNMIMSQSDKYGDRPYACSSNDAFHSFLDLFGMIDLGFLVILTHGLINGETIILLRNILIEE
jgi:hypothetical protein